jgi:hypothetical protein
MHRGQIRAREWRERLRREEREMHGLMKEYREGTLLTRVYAYQGPREGEEEGEEGEGRRREGKRPSEEEMLGVACMLTTCKFRYDLAMKVSGESGYGSSI